MPETSWTALRTIRGQSQQLTNRRPSPAIKEIWGAKEAGKRSVDLYIDNNDICLSFGDLSPKDRCQCAFLMSRVIDKATTSRWSQVFNDNYSPLNIPSECNATARLHRVGQRLEPSSAFLFSANNLYPTSPFCYSARSNPRQLTHPSCTYKHGQVRKSLLNSLVGF